METAALPLCYYPRKAIALLSFLVDRALLAAWAELHLFKTLGNSLLVTSRSVVAPFAFTARQYREITHFLSFLLLVSPRLPPPDHIGLAALA